MKRTVSFGLAFLLSLAILLSSVPEIASAAPTNSLNNATISSFEADAFSVVTGESKKVTFTAAIDSLKKLSNTDVAVYDDNDNFVTYMRDDGQGGDKLANDGIFTGVTTLSNNNLKKTVNYHAEVFGQTSASHPVKYRSEITEADFETANRIWDGIEAYENVLAEKGYSPEQIARSVRNYLENNEAEHLQSLKVENDRAFSFILKSGIENYFEHFEDVSDTGTDYEQMAETVKTLSYIGESSIGVWSPYYGVESNFTYNYLNRANAMKEIMGYDTVDSYYGAQASVNSFKNFDKYGVVLIDSHGADYNGGGYICIPLPGSYDSQDVADGHLVMSGGTMLLRGTFIQKYCGTLPNSIVYIGICHGMAANNLWQPLINHGAGFVCGYDDSVSFTFDGIIMDEFCTQLVSINGTTELQNTAGEAFDAAIAEHGDVDPYSSSRARFICEGDRDVVASAKAISVESISLSPSEATIYRLNTMQLELTLNPVDANRFKVEWTSDNPDVVSVDDKGMITAIASGTATVTCKVTDTSTDPASEFTAEAVITVDGDMAVSGLKIAQSTMTLYAGTSACGQVMAAVEPYNATNQKLLYASNDETIAKVDDTGKVTPVSEGRALITVTTEEGGFSGVVIVNVIAGDLNAALNKRNGQLSFSDTESAPASVVSVDQRFAAQTTNHNDGSSSAITLNAGQLPEGTVITFDWKVSSEAGYDAFKFAVNSSVLSDISGTRDWSSYTYEVTSERAYTFSWIYTKDYSASNGSDCGWLDEVEIIIPNATHTVTFLDMDAETVLETQTVAYGEDATPPEPPVHVGLRFVGWDTDYTTVRGDISVVAIYEEAPVNIYTVTFVGFDGVVLEEQLVEEGMAAVAPEVPAVDGHIFKNWDKDFSNVIEDMTVTAVYAKVFTVTFIGFNGEVLATEIVEDGMAATAPEVPVQDGYIFIGWDKDFSIITEDITVQATYCLIGDVNRDGLFNTGDASLLLRYCADMVQLDEVQLVIADYNHDDMINTGDVTRMLVTIASM